MAGPVPTIDRYTVEAELGSGGFGAVYRARHVVLGRAVALKVLHPQRATDTDVLQRFLREARAVAQLGSPHIVQVLDADMSADGRAFIAMELLEGEDLAHRLQRGGRIPTHEVLRLGREVLAALTVAHAQGVIHRDLKPGNVFLARGPGGEISAKVLDFGISKVRTEAPGDELTRTGTMLGTPHYMAPEQFRSSKDVDARADLHSLGVLLYEALAGKLPFEGTTLHQLIAAKLTDAPPPLAQIAPAVPHAVAEVVMRALETEPDRRHASAAAMDAALASVEGRVSAPGVSLGRSSARPAPMSTPPPSTTVAPSRTRRVLPWIVGIGAVLVMSAFLVLGVTLIGLYVARDDLRALLGGTTPVTSSPTPVLPTPVPVMPASIPIPIPAPAPAPAPDPTPIPSTDVAGVHVTSHALGLVSVASVSELADRARPALAACRGPSAYHEELQFTLAPGGRLTLGGLRGSGSAHDCVVAALESAGPVRSSMTGIARYDVSLDAR